LSRDETIQVISVVVQLLGVLIWPSVVVFFILLFRRQLDGFLGNLSELSVKAPGGLEATARRQEAAAALGAAAVSHATGDSTQELATDPKEIAQALPSARELRRLEGSRVLWVDDNPGNNMFERQALKALGIQIDLSNSTDDALEKIRGRSYDLVISDMNRPPDAQAGYTLLNEVRTTGRGIPFVLYTKFQSPAQLREAREHGAIGLVDQPQDLVKIVTNVLADKR
jgi:CheY-like chemotaxis protein